MFKKKPETLLDVYIDEVNKLNRRRAFKKGLSYFFILVTSMTATLLIYENYIRYQVPTDTSTQSYKVFSD